MVASPKPAFLTMHVIQENTKVEEKIIKRDSNELLEFYLHLYSTPSDYSPEGMACLVQRVAVAVAAKNPLC